MNDIFSSFAITPTTPNPLLNQGTVIYSYTIDTLPQTGVSPSNIVATTVSYGQLSTSKQVSTGYAMLGDILTYTIAVNYVTGNANLINVVLIDTLPSEITLVPNSLKVNGIANSGSLGAPGLNLGTLPPFGVITVTFNAVASTIPAVNPILNSAVVNYGYIIDPANPAVTTGALTNIVPTTIIYIDVPHYKTVDKQYATVGDFLTYTLIIPNNSNIDISNVIFNDTIPVGTTFVPNSLTINGTPNAGNPQNINLGTLKSYSVTTIQYRVVIDN